MIGRIKGQLIEKKIDSVVIDVSGIGYVVYVTEKTSRSLTWIINWETYRFIQSY